MVILGRADESARIERLLANARDGHGGALVIRGEAGIGKTALLDHAERAAAGLRVLRGVGIESEVEVPFAGLHLLFHTYLDRLATLPEPQAQALRAAFGLSDHDIGERFLTNVAALSLLSELAADGPVVCLVDDAHWFDRASLDALLFAARRLRQEPVAMVFTARADVPDFPAAGLETMRLAALDRVGATALLDQRAGDLTGPMRARILADARGNPLAIIEFTAAITSRAATGSTWSLPVEPLPVDRQVQAAFSARIGTLPEATRRLLVLAAADVTADPPIVVRAGERLGLSAADLEPAEQAALIELSAQRISFRHPLIRTAAYQSAPRHWQLDAHRALADTLTGADYADHRAWHLAAATITVDETAAATLEQVARRAARRGGAAAVAHALERSARLSPDPEQRSRRLAAAARAAYDAGALDQAADCARVAAEIATSGTVLADLSWVRAQIAYERDSPTTAAALMLAGAAPIVGTLPRQAVSMLTDAIGCAKDGGAHDLVSRAARLLADVRLAPDDPLRPVVDGMIGVGELFDGRARAGTAGMRRLISAAREGRAPGMVERVLAGYLALIIDDRAAAEILEALVADIRRSGALGWLPYAQEPLAIALLLQGRFRDAETVVTEALSTSTELGQHTQALIMSAIPAWLAAVAGDADSCRTHAATMLRDRARHPTNAALATWALGLLDLGQGRFDTATEYLESVCTGPGRRDFLVRAIPDHMEAAIRGGRTAQADRHLPALAEWAEHTRRPQADALVQRCLALAATDDPEKCYGTALRLHAESEHTYDYARTALLYGEWLRRQRRRTEAHTHLSEASRIFERLAATAWADRARAELTALGDRPVARPHDHDPAARLTPQELQVVRLAAAGLSNRDIAAQLFLSPRTVGHHLYRAYPKLGITKRTELVRFTL
ncbi:Transcriptional regulatory protein devR (dosR) [Nocardia otitidiscaviarum]|uniref:Transcriptional regulatory protein devR (DosR) n=1 Tax=Nocardia otitidiscaviarum TaxID=1823 RepID=A0A378YBV0_9NOCA|nr:Transcriptional regulatory protein devR (dosR) [Nocardia otitidiscaviarum]